MTCDLKENFPLGNGPNRNRKTEDNVLQPHNDNTSFRSSKGGTRYSRSATKNAFPSRRNSSRKVKDETKREDYQDYPADYLTCPVGELNACGGFSTWYLRICGHGCSKLCIFVVTEFRLEKLLRNSI